MRVPNGVLLNDNRPLTAVLLNPRHQYEPHEWLFMLHTLNPVLLLSSSKFTLLPCPPAWPAILNLYHCQCGRQAVFEGYRTLLTVPGTLHQACKFSVHPS